MYYTVIKHDRRLRTRRKCRKHDAAGKYFLHYRNIFQMSGVFYYSVIQDLGFFICFII